MSRLQRSRSWQVQRIKMPDQVQTGGALSVEHGYNGLLANGIDPMELQQHYK